MMRGHRPPLQQAEACPPRRVWKDFALGRLTEPQLDPLADHLNQCRNCRELIGVLEQERDTVMEFLLNSFERQNASYEAEKELAELTQSLLADSAQISRWSRSDDAPSGAIPLSPEIPSTIDKYHLIEPLGAGAAGRVYKAVHQRLRKPVSLKLLVPKRQISDDLVLRFEREMEAVGRISHQNVITATDAGQAEGFYFLAMEYAPGLDVDEIVTRLGRLSMADACEIVRQAALGVQAAHEHGLVHRDVKPSNLLLTDEGVVKVLDLGLVAISAGGDDGGTQRANAVGTPHYMAPEQWQGYRAGPGSDVYSLGCTLFKLLSGRAPYEHACSNRHELRRAHCKGRVPEIAALRPDVPREVRGILTRTLAKNPRKRFASAGELAALLSHWVEGADLQGCVAAAREFSLRDTLTRNDHDTVSGPAAARDRSSKWIWRLGGLILGLGLLVGGGVWSLFPSRELPAWEVKIPVSEEPLFCQAGRDPEVQIRPVGATDELVVDTGGRTLLQVGETADITFRLRTAIQLDAEERAGLFFSAQLLGTNGIRAGLVEVYRRPGSAADELVEFVVTVRHLYYDLGARRVAVDINRGIEAASVYLPASGMIRPTLELSASADWLEVSLGGNRAVQISRTEWTRKTANDWVPGLSDFTGPFGFYVFLGKVEFSHLRFFDR